MNSEGTCLRAEWSPALRWHDFYTGFYTERGNQFMDVKGEVRVGNPYKGLSTNALNWDGVVSSSEEDSLNSTLYILRLMRIKHKSEQEKT